MKGDRLEIAEAKSKNGQPPFLLSDILDIFLPPREKNH
jgi:hypothetical protein